MGAMYLCNVVSDKPQGKATSSISMQADEVPFVALLPVLELGFAFRPVQCRGASVVDEASISFACLYRSTRAGSGLFFKHA